MKVVYSFDIKTRKMTGCKITADDYKLAINETTLSPDRSQYEPYTLSADGTQWTGISREEYLKQHPATDNTKKPSAEQEMLMQQQAELVKQGATDAQLQNLLMSQSQTISMMQKMLMQQSAQVASLKKGDTK